MSSASRQMLARVAVNFLAAKSRGSPSHVLLSRNLNC